MSSLFSFAEKFLDDLDQKAESRLSLSAFNRNLRCSACYCLSVCLSVFLCHACVPTFVCVCALLRV